MAYVADLHLHSRFSRACSQEINIPNLSKWAKLKGIDLLGTGDFLHPLWQNELKNILKDTGNGVYEYGGVKFILTTEISCIYNDQGKTRRIHLVVLLPSLESVNKLSGELIKRRVNLVSDGRPITGLSAQELATIIFNVEANALIIPAHVWTPWFSLYGSESGYDSLKECFGQLSDQILAVETGLSSQPQMNWRVADLDNKTIISNSDAHSLPNLGREATIFKGRPTFEELRSDLKNENLIGTIEFFPEEGKYHYSGHRNCEVVFGPEELSKNGEVCPKCQRRLTIGVVQRVEKLATRSEEKLHLNKSEGVIKSAAFPNRPGFRMLVGLEKIIAEALGVGTGSVKVKAEYEKLVLNLDNELKILTKTPLSDIAAYAGEKVAEGVGRVREGKLTIKPGFDNTYGVISIWDNQEIEQKEDTQLGLF